MFNARRIFMSTAKGTALQLTQQSEIVTWPETHYVYLEKIGPFQETAPQAWNELHKLVAAISEHNKITGYTSLYKVGPKIYRAGVSIAAGERRRSPAARHHRHRPPPSRQSWRVDRRLHTAGRRAVHCPARTVSMSLKHDLPFKPSLILFKTHSEFEQQNVDSGAARVALGPELPALFGNDDGIVRELARISAAEHDPLWPMPLWAGYEDELASKIADLNNVASSTLAGAIFGALFLKRFVSESTRWVHIDLYAWNSKDRPGRSIGAEAQAVRGVYRYLVKRYGTV